MSDDSYVHDPDAFGDGEEPSASSSGAEPGERTFDWRNWVLVGAMLVAFLVVPILILFQPLRINSFVFTYLVLPLVPAFLLGALAVWATTR